MDAEVCTIVWEVPTGNDNLMFYVCVHLILAIIHRSFLKLIYNEERLSC